MMLLFLLLVCCCKTYFQPTTTTSNLLNIPWVHLHFFALLMWLNVNFWNSISFCLKFITQKKSSCRLAGTKMDVEPTSKELSLVVIGNETRFLSVLPKELTLCTLWRRCTCGPRLCSVTYSRYCANFVRAHSVYSTVDRSLQGIFWHVGKKKKMLAGSLSPYLGHEKLNRQFFPGVGKNRSSTGGGLHSRLSGV